MGGPVAASPLFVVLAAAAPPSTEVPDSENVVSEPESKPESKSISKPMSDTSVPSDDDPLLSFHCSSFHGRDAARALSSIPVPAGL